MSNSNSYPIYFGQLSLSPTLGVLYRARNTTTPSVQASQSVESKERSTLPPRGFDGAQKLPLVTKAQQLSDASENMEV